MSAEQSQAAIATSFSVLRSDRAYEWLTRSVYDVSLAKTVTCLLDRDASVPILTANALRHSLATQDNPEQQWDTSREFAVKVVAETASDPVTYAKKVINDTRNSIRRDGVRKDATGMVFYGSSTEYEGVPGSLAYGMLWAYERREYQGHDLTNKVVGTFVAHNTFEIDLPGEMPGELVHPALVLNSSLEYSARQL